MQRQLFSPKTGEYNPNTRPITQGGTSAKTAVQAAANLGGFVAGVDVPESFMTLNEAGKLPIAKFGSMQLSGLSVEGMLQVAKKQTYTYKITDYDFKKAYTATATKGTVSLAEDTITYTAPDESTTDTIYLNGRPIPVVVDLPKPLAPTITSPKPGTYIVGNTVSFTSSPFVTGQATQGEVHHYSQWQVSEYSDFRNTVTDSGASGDKLAWVASNLSVNKSYYVRVRYYGNATGWGHWSPVVKINMVQSLTTNSETFTLNPGPTTGQQARLVPSYHRSSDQFGYSVALSENGNVCVVSSLYGEDSANKGDTGRAFVFVRIQTGWSQKAVLSHPDLRTGENFGYSVAVSGDGKVAAVGAVLSQSLTPGVTNGAVYIYTEDPVTKNWNFKQRVEPHTVATTAYSGFSVALSYDGSTMAVGNPYDDKQNVVADMGSVSIFVKDGDTWVSQSLLWPNIGASSVHFGTAVSLSNDGNTLAVGADNDYLVANTSGAVYIFTRTDSVWTQQAKLTNTEESSGELFGANSVALSGDGLTCVVGAPNKSTPNKTTYEGAAYVFKLDAGVWTKQARLLAEEGKTYDYFGRSVSINNTGDKIVVGAYGLDKNSLSESGAVYFFTLSGETWSVPVKLASKDIEVNERFGWSVDISGDGTTCAIGAPYQYYSSGSLYIYV